MNRTDMLVTTPLLDSKNSLADWFAIATFIESPVLLLMLCWCIVYVYIQDHQEKCALI